MSAQITTAPATVQQGTLLVAEGVTDSCEGLTHRGTFDGAAVAVDCACHCDDAGENCVFELRVDPAPAHVQGNQNILILHVEEGGKGHARSIPVTP